MTNTTIDVSKVPGAVLVPYFSMFQSLTNGQGIENQASYMQAEVERANASNIAAFAFAVKNWTNDALAARDVLHQPPPPKPTVPLLQVFLRMDLPANGGSWLAEVDGAPVGVCPDLPAAVAPSVPAVTGLVPTGTRGQLTVDQKLDGIWEDLTVLKAALAKQGIQ